MKSLVPALFAAIIASGRVNGGQLSTNHLRDTKAGSHKGQYLPPTVSTPVGSDAVATNQGWNKAASLGYSGPIAVPEVRADGTIAETAEVAAARAFHLAALAAARASDPDMGRDDGEYDPQKYGDHLYGIVPHHEDILQNILSYQALATLSPVYGAPGAGMQTLTKAMNEASASGAVYGAPAQRAHAAGLGIGVGGSAYAAPVEENKPYLGPLAMLQVLGSGYLADTPEVIAARNIHLKALQEAQAAADLWRLKSAGAAQNQPWG